MIGRSSFAVLFFVCCLQRRSEDEEIQQNPEAVLLLTPEQYCVTDTRTTKSQDFIDVVLGKPLISSIDKFDSGTDWPGITTQGGDR